MADQRRLDDVNETTTLTLSDFLLARIAEDEAAARVRPEHYAPFEREWEWCPRALTEPLGDLEWGPNAPCYCGVDKWRPSPRALAECEAKRRIVEGEPARYDDGVPGENEANEEWAWTCRVLAAVYADHPDYREEWRP